MSFLNFENALVSKNYTKLDLVNVDLDWQCVLSYTYDEELKSPPNLHTQDYFEMILHIRSGRAFFIKDTRLRPAYGDVLLFPPELPHKGIDIAESAFERYYMYLNPAVVGYLPDGDLISGLFRPESPNLIRFGEEVRDEMISGFEPLRGICRVRGKNNTCADREILFSLRLHALKFLYELIRHKNNNCDGGTITLPPMLESIIGYMAVNFASIGSINELAERFRISESYMSRLFREWLRTTPYKHLRAIRMIEAKKLLRQGASVTEACFGSGFGDCSHFIGQFKEEFGITPGEWKERS